LAPLAGYLLLVTYAAYVALKIGHWPTYSNPDPKTLDSPIWDPVVSFAVTLSSYAIPVAILSSVLVFFFGTGEGKAEKKTVLLWSIVPVFVCLVVLLDIRMNGPLNWYLD